MKPVESARVGSRIAWVSSRRKYLEQGRAADEGSAKGRKPSQARPTTQRLGEDLEQRGLQLWLSRRILAANAFLPLSCEPQ